MDDRADKKKVQSGNFLLRRLFRKEINKQDFTFGPDENCRESIRSSSDISLCHEASLEEVASTSRVYSEHHVGSEYVMDNGSLLSLQPWIFRMEQNWKLEEEDSDALCRWSHDLSGYEWTLCVSPNRMRSSNWNNCGKRHAHRHILRPVTYTENFMPHFPDNVGVEEYAFSSLPSSPVRSERLSFLTDKRTMSKLRDDVVGEQPESIRIKNNVYGTSFEKSHNQTSCPTIGESTTVIGVPQLPETRKAKRKSREPIASIDTSFSNKLCRTSNPHGFVDGIFFFLLGVAVGFISSMLTNKLEVEKLKKLLKDNEDLVQDLHEELEMKDSLTVKELTNRNHGNQEFEHFALNICKNVLQNHKSEGHDASWPMDNCDHECLTIIQNCPEELSEIEAELEAELERLEQNITASSIGQKNSNLSQLDQELVADVIVCGELRQDLLDNDAREGETDVNNGTCTTSDTHAYNPNYSVSPKELSLRLHKVIESRLEARIKELETELEESQRKLNLVEAAKSCSRQSFSGVGVGSLHLDNNPTSFQESDSHPLCLNLADDALNAYSEAYEDFIRLTETEEDEKMSSISTGDLPGVKQSNLSKEFKISKMEAWEDLYWTEGEEDNLEDEGKDLIQKIVEKTRQGSPALINAQRMLFLMDL
ncbi:hypothetical protein AXF42_Ash009177 [Apostasia shenzhenica]|uniref:Uncharacterized protein n=1 Tax=Apostasia shenzhenica TaxID=1088818 RepID=A0A2I0ADQ3_9ASPA|nr:hypothetical protein AXF42_Ash009177 [Apostasia shenzhenica]